jgi:hypothetical protein
MHNIVLKNGRHTMPESPILSETSEVKRMIDFATKEGFTDVVDLGAGEGGYSVAFERSGFRVTAVEPRIENCQKIFMVAGNNLIIRSTTVENYLKVNGVFPEKTLILCLGLLYHLPDPAATLADISRKTSGLILSTHYAIYSHWQYDRVPPGVSWLFKRICKRAPWLFRYRHYGLSKLCFHNGSPGRWYPEYPTNLKDVSRLTHSSFHNPQSFWLTRDIILNTCEQMGLLLKRSSHRERDQGLTAFFKRE